MFSSKDLFFTVPSGFRVSNSLRFRSSASAYLNRTPASAGNRTTYTWSGWVKRGIIGASNLEIFGAGSTAGNFDGLAFISDTIQFQLAAATVANLTTTQVFRDPSAWYHFVVAVDTTQATAANRIKLYVNGSQITAFSTATYPALNAVSSINNTVGQYIGAVNAGSIANILDGYQAEVNFIDGQALTPSSFGAYDTNGVWQPAQYTGTYGTNGFYLPFTNTTSTTTLVADSSGNGNNWTPNNISLTSGTTYDSMIDSPTNYADGGNGRGNYAVLNPIAASGFSGAAQNGNLTANGSGGAGVLCATIGMTTGKWYAEVTCVAVGDESSVGISATAMGFANSYVGVTSTSWGYYTNGYKYTNSSGSAYGASWTTNDTIGIAFDADAGTLVFYKNGSTQGTAFTGLNSGPYYFAVEARSATPNNCAINFGQQPFRGLYVSGSGSSYVGTGTPPSGFSALNTQNLPTPTIANGAQYMAAVTYTGNGSTQTITASTTNSGNNPLPTTFQPDFVWIKNRTIASQHVLTDVVRGVDKQLFTSLTNAEQTSATGITSFNSNGFSLGSNVAPTGDTNSSTNSFIAWEWKANGTGVSNTSGSITSTVSANTSAGFSVVTFTAPASGGFTVGHGLGVTPGMIIGKDRTNANSWAIWHQSLSTPSQSYLQFSTGAANANTTIWNNTAPTSSVISMGVGGIMNASANTVLYCFAPVAGYSAFGSYTGNGSADGPFVYTGFRPRYVLIKCSNAAGTGWYIYDTSRNTYNVLDLYLRPEVSDAEGTLATMDVLSNGFKLRSSNSQFNGSGNTMIYAAFAENPFRIARAR